VDLRLSWANPVIAGFMHGLAVVIAVGQMPKVPGVQGGGETTAAQWVLREKELADDQC
jgi:MFS superfamily sulfate permease-like transporter